MEIFDIKKELESLDPEEIDRIKLLLQRINDTLEGGLRSANFKEYRNTYVINAQDSLDATYPMYVHFNIISEMVKIVSIKLSFWFLNFRAYSTGAKSGGGATPTTSDGGGATPTSSEGGGQTSSYKVTPSGGGSTPTSESKTTPSGGGHTGGSGGGQTSSVTQQTAGYDMYLFPVHVTNVGDENQDGWIGTELKSGGLYIPTENHTHTVANHTHWVYNHTHPSHSHTVTIPNHTHPTHAHTVSDHHHTVTIAEHNHTVTIADHAHDIIYGIHEEENSPTIMPYISRDNGLTYSLPIGSYTKDQKLDITRFIDKAGSKMIKFTSTTRARLSVQVTIKLDIKAR